MRSFSPRRWTRTWNDLPANCGASALAAASAFVSKSAGDVTSASPKSGSQVPRC
jgi:hypothetical protein